MNDGINESPSRTCNIPLKLKNEFTIYFYSCCFLRILVLLSIRERSVIKLLL